MILRALTIGVSVSFGIWAWVQQHFLSKHNLPYGTVVGLLGQLRATLKRRDRETEGRGKTHTIRREIWRGEGRRENSQTKRREKT